MSNAFAIGASGGGTTTVTASAIVAPVVGSGSHILRIDGYSCTKGIGNGTHIASETFTAGGHRWCLHYYPDSPNRHDSGEICIFLKLVDVDADKVEAKYTISLLDHDGNPRSQYIRVGQRTFSSRDTSTPGVGLIERSELEGCGYLKDDAFVIRCDIIVVKEIFTKAIPISEVLRPVMKREM